MAISRYQGGSTTNLGDFANWLNEHKQGTFLENLTIALSQTVNTNDTLSISDDEVTVKFTVQSGSNKECFRFTGASYTAIRKTTGGTGVTAYITGALLCNKGLMLQYYAGYSSSTSVTVYAVCITVDSDGKLAAIVTATQNTIPEDITSIITNWIAATSKSTTDSKVNCRPYYSANLTSLAPITAMAIDTNARLPYAYAAISTQLNSEGLSPVIIDGAPYITNGVWYIKDGD